MTKVNKDDIAAIVSRMDAAMAVMIELTAEAHGMDVEIARSKYTLKYDRLTKKFRRHMIVKE